ncbi:MAG: DNA alkylation repair protein [Ferruginibacter sp.]
MHPYVTNLARLFEQHANAEKAAAAKAYMRNQFEYLGLTAATRQRISKACIKDGLPGYDDLETIVTALWRMPEREYQYFAIDLVAAFKKSWKKDIIKLLEFILLNKSWWDTVDATSNLTGAYFKIFPGQVNTITGKWNRSGNFWLQRSSILFQLKYKKDTDTILLAEYILALVASKEFFVQKAIGWILREYSKTNSKWVQDFVKQNRLAPLSEREALKRIQIK